MIARVGDRYVAGDTGRFTVTSSVTNAAEARNAASKWANILVAALDKAKDLGKK